MLLNRQLGRGCRAFSFGIISWVEPWRRFGKDLELKNQGKAIEGCEQGANERINERVRLL